MSTQIHAQPWIELEELITKGNLKNLSQFLENISPAETARAVSRLDEEHRVRLLALLSPQDAANVLLDLPDEQAADMIEDISPGEAAEIMNNMPGGDQVDILADLDSSDAEAILDAMSPQRSKKTRQLLQYPEDSAGGIMGVEYLAYSETMTVGEVLEDLQVHSEEYSDYEVQYAYITSSKGRLRGVLRMRDLILLKRGQRVSSIMIANPIHVRDDTALEDLIQLFSDNTYLGIPVTNIAGDLVGIVRRAQVLEASGRRADKSFLKVSGIVGGEEFRSMPFTHRSFRRLSWLSINIVLNIIAASVIAFYQDTLTMVIALAVFLPIISDMSGCSGNQAVAVSIRELTLGLIKPYEVTRVLLKEAGVGVVNGLILGILLGAVAVFWQNNFYLGLVVGGALATNTVVAVSLGGAIPLILKWAQMDPALASSPILTTVTDMCGFFLTLSFATALLPLLS
ncbi:MAG: magnesium transporter [Pseudomonadota bacterium]